MSIMSIRGRWVALCWLMAVAVAVAVDVPVAVGPDCVFVGTAPPAVGGGVTRICVLVAVAAVVSVGEGPGVAVDWLKAQLWHTKAQCWSVPSPL